jgi:hypothetical protein
MSNDPGGLGSGGFFGAGGGQQGGYGGPWGYGGPRGPYGPWPSLGCSSFIIVFAGMLLACGGCLRMIGQ